MQAAHQVETLRSFVSLCEFRYSWSGALLVGIGLDVAGRALALASVAAGAAALFLEGDRQMLRAAQREGCCSFSVSTLEEAIRALKNEVRQGRAISIALGSDTELALAEIVRRGLQPQAVAFTRKPLGSEAVACRTLTDRGAVALSGLPPDLKTDWETWRIAVDSAPTAPERRQRDVELLAAAEKRTGHERLAGRWLRAAPSLFPRALDRAYLVTASAT